MATKPARTQAERREEAERRILQAAIRLLVEKGYDRFSLAEVGDLAGYSRGLPGHYFGKKEDLLSQVAMFIVAGYRESVAVDGGHARGLPLVLARIRAYVRGFGTRPNRALNVLIAEARFRPALRRTIMELNQRSRERWQNEIRMGVEAGNVRADINPVAIGSMIHAFLRGQSTFADLDPGYDVNATMEAFVRHLEQILGPHPTSAG
ncbi:TetR/AcrR family transcriptional regulator [Phenylobacterium sp.]|uniref:TetR/AcrR family transcriptional regulator n=1 Tax=Phenylobacterium sp. TaxID=1871053 RepID=UPI00301C1B42